MLDLLKIIKGLSKKLIVHGPKKGEKITIDLKNAPVIDLKAFCHLTNVLYSKKKNYKLNPPEEISFYIDLINSGAQKDNLDYDDLSEYQAYIFNNRHKLAA